MITKELQFPFEYFPNNSSFSVQKEQIVKEDGETIGKKIIDTRAFLPGQIDELAKYLGEPDHPLVSYCNIIWTPDMIATQEEINARNLGLIP